MPTTGLPAAQRSLIASNAALTRWSRVNSREARAAATAAASKGLRKKWEIEVDPDGVLSPAELEAAVQRRKSAHYRLMALRSAQARSGRPKTGNKRATTAGTVVAPDPQPISASK